MKKFDSESYEHVENLVEQYQQGNSEVALELLDLFKGYLGKYFLLIKEGMINFDDRDTRNFLNLFISDKQTRTALKRSRQSSEVRTEAHKAAHSLQSRCKCLDKDDLEQEIACAFLTLVNRYEKKGKNKNFAGYLYNSYRYELYRQIEKITKDPVGFASEYNISYDDEENIPLIEGDSSGSINFEDLPSIIGDELSTNWIHGNTASEIFENLTPFDRLILKLYYVDGLRDHEIATKTGYHRQWIIRKRHAAIKHIAGRIDNVKDNKND